jgi:hypothetical protein
MESKNGFIAALIILLGILGFASAQQSLNVYLDYSGPIENSISWSEVSLELTQQGTSSNYGGTLTGVSMSSNDANGFFLRAYDTPVDGGESHGLKAVEAPTVYIMDFNDGDASEYLLHVTFPIGSAGGDFGPMPIGTDGDSNGASGSYLSGVYHNQNIIFSNKVKYGYEGAPVGYTYADDITISITSVVVGG